MEARVPTFFIGGVFKMPPPEKYSKNLTKQHFQFAHFETRTK